MAKKVVILGGGVAGLSAAHELAERGFDVVVYEKKHVPGGKARSFPILGTGTDGRRNLPGEHGFRFFPGFYKHLPDTMQRIPFANQPNGVRDNLVQATRAEIARNGARAVITPARFPQSLAGLHVAFQGLFESRLGIPPQEILYFVSRLLTLATSCEERRLQEYENISWWDFIGAANRSTNYQRFLAVGLSRSLVACRAEEISARTGGDILLQLLFDMATPGVRVDRLLNGPTDTMWMHPWLTYLAQRGVRYDHPVEVQQLHYEGKRLTGVTILHRDTSQSETVTADYYIAAFPVEVAQQLFTDTICEADPRLANIKNLRTAWMNGIQFYLKQDVPIVSGHTIYIDSPWALTSISQQQFWRENIAATYGDGTVHGILSVDVSNWDKAGVLYNLPAEQCTRKRIKQEVWTQLKMHLNVNGAPPVLDDENLVGWDLDPDIREPDPQAPHPGTARNLEPLLINTKGSWQSRPEATTQIENLFLASDYVRTYTDLATMEAANEAARRAVNAILDVEGSPTSRCVLWPLHEPEIFAPLREFDSLLYKAEMVHPLDRPVSALLENGVAYLRDFTARLGLSQHAAPTLFQEVVNGLRTLS